MIPTGSHARSHRIKQKYEEDQAHVNLLLQRGWHPMEISDRMKQVMIDALREGLRQQHPDWDDAMILDEMRDKLARSE